MTDTPRTSLGALLIRRSNASPSNVDGAKTTLKMLTPRPRRPAKNWPRPTVEATEQALASIESVDPAHRSTVEALLRRHLTERRHAEDPARRARLRAHIAASAAEPPEIPTMKTEPRTSLSRLRLKRPADFDKLEGRDDELKKTEDADDAKALIKAAHKRGGVALHLPQALRKDAKK